MKKPVMIAGGLVGLVVIAIVAVVAIQLLRSDDPNLATEAPAIPTRTAATPSAGAEATATTESGPTAATNLPEGVRQFVIVSAESEAKYVVEETLQGLVTNAVGTTSAITGEIYLSEKGLWDGAESSFQVDLRTLKSDESRRDNFIGSNTLQTSQFPFAVFVIDSIDGFPAGYVEGDEVQLTLTGRMTIKDVEQTLTWTVLSRQSGSILTATADTDFTFADFGMSPPNVAIAQAKEGIHVQVVLVAEEPV